jgi:maltose alpha-D-glucosyltransferase/alpha-amylase
MRVLIDLVVNHTSNEHPWFQEARRDPKSKYRDWYVWSKKRPAGTEKGVVFPGGAEIHVELRQQSKSLVLPSLL